MRLITKIWASKYFYPSVLILIGIVLAAANFTPFTTLIGWDSLHPEFNFPLNLTRMLTGVWRTDQGLGAVAGHSHMADLPRVILMWLGSLVMPANILRYLFSFMCLVTGQLGIDALVSKFTKRLPAFLSAIVYLANLGTVQHFNVPFEMFAIAYSLTPWLFLLSHNFVASPSRKTFLAFTLMVILTSPMAYAATLWYATFALLFLFILIFSGIKNLKVAAILIISTILLNFYWLAPNLYFIKNHGTDVAQAKVNRLFSPEAFAKNQEFGNVKDTVIFKNFLFDWQLFDFKTQRFEPVLKPWIEHLNNPLTASLGYLIFAVSALGIVRVIIKKDKFGLAILPVFLLSFLIILNGTWPINSFFNLLSAKFPVVAEALRFPFTKFSILLMLTMSIFVGQGLTSIMLRLNNPKLKSLVAIFFFAGSLWYFWPAFTGNLINPAMRISVPDEYFQMFNWFNTHDHNGRVAILPINSFWNWTYYSWGLPSEALAKGGYQGAGFLQFGIPQPILDRDYDRWNGANEQYQREMAYAIYSQNPQVISQVLTKFNIRWILFDKSVMAPGQVAGSTVVWLIPDLLKNTAGVKLVHQFGKNILIYQVNSTSSTSDLSLKNNLPTVSGTSNGFPFDNKFAELGDYQSQAFNPVTAASDFDRMEHYLGPLGNPVSTLSFSRLNPLSPCGQVEATIKTSRIILTDSVLYTSSNGPLCDHWAFSQLDHAKTYALTITSRNVSGFPLEVCVSNNLTRHCDLFIRLGEQKEFKTETYLLPSLSDYGSGYTVNLNNYAVNGQTSVNEIKSLTISEAPYKIPGQFQSLAVNSNGPPEQFTLSHPNPAFYKISFQPIAFSTQQNTLVLNQAFDDGWKAWVVTRDKRQAINQISQTGIFSVLSLITYRLSPLPHVLVNNWANGWEISQIYKSDKSTNPTNKCNNSTIVIFFWPQLLEWLGFALLPVPFILARYNKH